jgi:hypothetical protein
MNLTFIALLSVSLHLQSPMPVTGLLAVPPSSYIQDNTNRVQGRNQQSLPPDKQKSLTTLGPEDVFPAQSDERNNAQRRSRRVPTRSSSVARPAVNPPASITTPVPTQPQSTQDMDVTVEPTPSPTATPAVIIKQLAQEDPSQPYLRYLRLSLQNLALLTLLVSSALIFVLFKLMSKLREGSG